MNQTTKSILAKNIRYYLEVNNISQIDFARAIGVVPSAVTQWLQEKTSPHADTIDVICRYFGISREELLRDPDRVITVSKTIPLYHTAYHQRQHADEPYIDSYIAVDQKVKADFGVIISSDKMEGAGIYEKDVAFFVKNYSYTDGHIYAVWNIKSDLVYVKHVYHQDGHFNLTSAKYNEPPILLKHNDAILMGEISGIYKEWKYGKEI